MKKLLVNIHVKLFTLLYGEEGQDLVEVALLVSLVAAAITVGAHKEATAIGKVFTNTKKALK
ncbi:MAG: hypothetical protein WAL75_24795 [Terracidiphilus sp.]